MVFKSKLEFFIIPIIFLFLTGGIIFFEVIKNISQPKLKIEITNLTNQEKDDFKSASEVLFQIQLMKKELKNLEKKNKEVLPLREKIDQFERKLINEKDIFQIKKICQDFWDSGLWEEIYDLERK